MNSWTGPRTVYVTYIVTTAEKLWAALTGGEITRQYFFGRRIESEWKVGAPVRYWQENGTLDVEGTILECDPPRRVSFTWRVMWIEEYRNLPPARVTFQLDSLGEVVRLTITEAHDESIRESLLEGGRKGWPVSSAVSRACLKPVARCPGSSRSSPGNLGALTFFYSLRLPFHARVSHKPGRRDAI